LGLQAANSIILKDIQFQTNAVTKNYHIFDGNLGCGTWVSYTPVRYIVIMVMLSTGAPLLIITKTSRDNQIMYTEMYDSKNHTIHESVIKYNS
jgi:hypothetical protein